MRARVISTRKEADRLQATRIGRIEYRQTIAEHVADVHVPAIDHNLHTIRAPTNVAVGNVFDTPANPLRRARGIFGCSRRLREIRRRSQAKQCLHVFTPSDECHVRNGIYSPAYVIASVTSHKTDAWTILRGLFRSAGATLCDRSGSRSSIFCLVRYPWPTIIAA